MEPLNSEDQQDFELYLEAKKNWDGLYRRLADWDEGCTTAGSKQWMSHADRQAFVKSRKYYDTNALIKEITPENRHAEIDSGKAVGNEVW